MTIVTLTLPLKIIINNKNGKQQTSAVETPTSLRFRRWISPLVWLLDPLWRPAVKGCLNFFLTSYTCLFATAHLSLSDHTSPFAWRPIRLCLHTMKPLLHSWRPSCRMRVPRWDVLTLSWRLTRANYTLVWALVYHCCMQGGIQRVFFPKFVFSFFPFLPPNIFHFLLGFFYFDKFLIFANLPLSFFCHFKNCFGIFVQQIACFYWNRKKIFHQRQAIA